MGPGKEDTASGDIDGRWVIVYVRAIFGVVAGAWIRGALSNWRIGGVMGVSNCSAGSIFGGGGCFIIWELRAVDGEHRGNRACVPPSDSWKTICYKVTS